MIVVDASVIVEVLLRTPAANAIESRLFARRETLHAPHLIDVEVAQVVRRYVSRGDVQPRDGRDIIELMARWPMTRYPHEPLLRRIWELRENLTAFDAAYVALAEGLRAHLLTRDERLANAPGIQANIEVV